MLILTSCNYIQEKKAHFKNQIRNGGVFPPHFQKIKKTKGIFKTTALTHAPDREQKEESLVLHFYLFVTTSFRLNGTRMCIPSLTRETKLKWSVYDDLNTRALITFRAAFFILKSWINYRWTHTCRLGLLFFWKLRSNLNSISKMSVNEFSHICIVNLIQYFSSGRSKVSFVCWIL